MTEGLAFAVAIWQKRVEKCKPEEELIAELDQLHRAGAAWWMRPLPQKHKKLASRPICQRLAFGHPALLARALRYAPWIINERDELGRSAEDALPCFQPSDSLWVLRKQTLYCFLAIHRFRRESQLARLPRDVMLIIARLYYAPNRCPTCRRCELPGWELACSSCGVVLVCPGSYDHHAMLACLMERHQPQNCNICAACANECDRCARRYCKLCVSGRVESKDWRNESIVCCGECENSVGHDIGVIKDEAAHIPFELFYETIAPWIQGDE